MESWWPGVRTRAEDWENALLAIAGGQRDVNARDENGRTLLHHAASCNGTAAHMQRLLQLGANPSAVADEPWGLPMHECAERDALDKCECLPVADIARDPYEGKMTPFEVCVLGGSFRVLQWMVNQPECPVVAFVREELPRLMLAARRVTLLTEEAARRRRWSPLRAALVGAVVGT
jgi:hypothetical protein